MTLQMLLLESAASQVMPRAQLCPPSMRWVTFIPITAQTPWPAGELEWYLGGKHGAARKGDAGASPQRFRARRNG